MPCSGQTCLVTDLTPACSLQANPPPAKPPPSPWTPGLVSSGPLRRGHSLTPHHRAVPSSWTLALRLLRSDLWTGPPQVSHTLLIEFLIVWLIVT